MTTTSVMVGMAEIHIAKGAGQFTCLGLGSCIGICALDPIANVGGCAHIMLPESFADKIVDRPGKFANTGVPELINVMERLGAQKSRLVIAIAGGAQVFKFGSEGVTNKLDIGARNAVAVNEALKLYGLKAIAADLGGNVGRTVTFTLETGVVNVRTATATERQLTILRK